MRIINIGARKSDLARLQAYSVGRALLDKNPNLEIKYHFKESLGDKNLTDPLWKMPDRGVFTEDFVNDLLEDKVDLVVHSWKDLPTESREKTKIIATMDRADPRDLLLLKEEVFSKKSKKLKLLSSSPRRAYTLPNFLREYMPFEITDAEFISVRGNIPTRLRKLLEQNEDGILVAKAALDRLLSTTDEEFLHARNQICETLKKCRFIVLPLAVHPTAAAQGALAVEIGSHRKDMEEILATIHNEVNYHSVSSERKILASYGGGCHQKIGITILDTPYGRVEYLQGLTDRGETLNRNTWLPNKNPPAFAASECWPIEEDQNLFLRNEIECEQPKEHFFVSKADALPTSWKINSETQKNYIWTSGLDTWKKLASRGVFVCGSAEGLGEEFPSIAVFQQAINDEKKWVKLSHDKAPGNCIPLLATYSLFENDKPNLKGKKYFFWSSGSAFKRALALCPEIEMAHHACGIGHTLNELKKIIPNDRIYPFLSYKHWKESLL